MDELERRVFLESLARIKAVSQVSLLRLAKAGCETDVEVSYHIKHEGCTVDRIKLVCRKMRDSELEVEIVFIKAERKYDHIHSVVSYEEIFSNFPNTAMIVRIVNEGVDIKKNNNHKHADSMSSYRLAEPLAEHFGGPLIGGHDVCFAGFCGDEPSMEEVVHMIMNPESVVPLCEC